MNWPLWGGMLAMVLLARHTWVLFAPSERAVPAAAIATQSVQAGQLFGVVNTTTPSASLSGIRPIGIFASRNAGFAVMQTESGQVGVGVGSLVVPGVRLVETHPDYVMLERNGVRQRADLVKAPAAGGGITPTREGAPGRTDPALAAQARLLDQLTPEQRTILQQQQLLRGRP